MLPSTTKYEVLLRNNWLRVLQNVRTYYMESILQKDANLNIFELRS
jgi:hypothetical protein